MPWSRRKTVIALGAMCVAIAGCNAITGAGQLAVDETVADSGAVDGMVTPTPTTTTTGSVMPPPPDPPIDSGSSQDAEPDADAGRDAGTVADARADADAAVPDADAAKPFPPTATVWPTASGGNGHAYEVVVGPDAIHWDAAKSGAIAKGGHLVSITSSAENLFVRDLVVTAKAWSGDHGPWLGGTQLVKTNEPAGNWTWTTGEAFGFIAWLPEEPNDFGGNEDYLAYLGATADAMWNDFTIDGDGEIFSYVVEYE